MGYTLRLHLGDRGEREKTDKERRQDNNMPGKDALTALANEIKALDKGVKKLEKFAKQIGTDRDSRKTRKKLTEAHVDCITRAKQLQKRFRELAEDADPRISKLKRDFSTILKTLEKTYDECSTKMRERSLSRSFSTGGEVNLEFGTSASEDARGQQQQQQQRQAQVQQQSQVQQTAVNGTLEVEMAIAKEEAEEIKNIERDLLAVRDIFQDISVLVQDQGEHIDIIEENVNVTADNVQKGMKDLEVANELQQKARKKKCIVAAAFLIILLLITGGTLLAVLNNS